MKIAFIATYPPRECGIGTFTQSLCRSLIGKDENEIFIVAMHDNHENYHFPEEVKCIINQEKQTDYLKAADLINQSGADVCILQHEFGIFGGDSGVYILPLLHRLKIPLITTLHTILETPSYNEKAVLKQISNLSDKLVVMTDKGKEFLKNIYEVPTEKITRIDHGIPDLSFNKEETRKELKFENNKIILTFGFVGRNKGIETVIRAMPSIIEKHPEVRYYVLGKTHPNVLKHFGEEYRNSLLSLIKTLGLKNHVFLLNEFAEEKKLFKYLAACDIYITPYVNEAQITSGTLTYAMGAGCAVVSTPYWHAAELLADNKGRLFDFKNDIDLVRVINDLLDNPQEMKEIQSKALEYGKEIIWPKVGNRYLELSKRLIEKGFKSEFKIDSQYDLLEMPPFSLDHVKRLTDDTGIIQHAQFGIPNLKEGYCLDDNSRALLMVTKAFKQKKSEDALQLMPIYLSYISYLQNEDGTFRNFLSFNRNFLDEVGSEDSFGRTIWALGYLMNYAPNDAYYQTARMLFLNAYPQFEKLESIRGMANTMIGISYYMRLNPSDLEMKNVLITLTDKLIVHYEENKSKGWNWFESLLAYDNGILPLSLLHAYEVLDYKKAKEVAFEAVEFLITHTFNDGYLSIIGNKKWYVKNGERSVYAQQPIDAMAMVLLFHQAYVITRDKEFLEKLFISFKWFLGENDLRMSLFDYETKGCCDGFESYGVNRNQGAESTLAYYISYLSVLQAFEFSYNYSKEELEFNSNEKQK